MTDRGLTEKETKKAMVRGTVNRDRNKRTKLIQGERKRKRRKKERERERGKNKDESKKKRILSLKSRKRESARTIPRSWTNSGKSVGGLARVGRLTTLGQVFSFQKKGKKASHGFAVRCEEKPTILLRH